MKWFICLSVALFWSMCAVPAKAGPLDDGNAAMHRKDFAAALELLGPLARDGNAIAQFNLGFLFDEGLGVPQNHMRAFNWYLKAANQGLIQAQYVVSYYYRRGRGMQQNTVEALMWIDLAASGGLPHADIELQEQEDQMTRAAIAEGQRQAARWLANHPRPWACPQGYCPRARWLPIADWNWPFYWYGL
jgi:uncharacterized protein